MKHPFADLCHMVRPREFDEQDVRQKILRLFWERGFAETSTRDIVTHTGVSHAGIYNVFGSKRELYKMSLEQYDDTIGDMVLSDLEAPPAGRAEIEAFFNYFKARIPKNGFPNGCFFCNTAIEFGDDDCDILMRAQKGMSRLVAAFEASLRMAVKRGEVRKTLVPKESAHFFANTFFGLAVSARAKVPSIAIKHTIETALRELD